MTLEVSNFIGNSNRLTFKQKIKDGHPVAEVYLNDNYIMDIEPHEYNLRNFTMSLRHLLDQYKIYRKKDA